MTQDTKPPTDWLVPIGRADLLPPSHPGTALRLRRGATPEETKTLAEMHRQQLAVRVEQAIVMLSQLSLVELGRHTNAMGLRSLQLSQHTMSEAKGTLSPENFKRFVAFSDRALSQAMLGLLEVQALDKENVFDIIADSPNFRDLPEEKKGFIRRILEAVVG